MDKKAAILITTNPESTPEQLEELLPLGVEFCRLVALHPNASASVLYAAITASMNPESLDDDIETLQNALRNANAPIDMLIELGRKYPADLLKNPALEHTVTEHPNILEQVPGILELYDLPEYLIRHVINFGNCAQKLSLIRNPFLPAALPSLLKNELNHEKSLDRLAEFSGKQEYPEYKLCLDAFAKTSRDFCIPTYLPLDKSDPKQRFEDQVIKGFPFTSTNWPWPKTADDNHMQPVAQINLKNAGELLEENLGDGLLQVWDDPDPMGKHGTLLRIIPASSFEEELSWDYPENTPWDPELDEEDDSDCLFFLNSHLLPSPRIRWIRIGRMFPDARYALKGLFKENPKFNQSQIELLSEDIGKLDIPSCWNIDEKTKCLQLGGFPLSVGSSVNFIYGGDDDTKLLLNIVPEAGGVLFTLQVTYQIDESGDPKFKVGITVNR